MKALQRFLDMNLSEDDLAIVIAHFVVHHEELMIEALAEVNRRKELSSTLQKEIPATAPPLPVWSVDNLA